MSTIQMEGEQRIKFCIVLIICLLIGCKNYGCSQSADCDSISYEITDTLNANVYEIIVNNPYKFYLNPVCVSSFEFKKRGKADAIFFDSDTSILIQFKLLTKLKLESSKEGDVINGLLISYLSVGDAFEDIELIVVKYEEKMDQYTRREFVIKYDDKRQCYHFDEHMFKQSMHQLFNQYEISLEKEVINKIKLELVAFFKQDDRGVLK